MNMDNLILFLLHYVNNPLENQISKHEVVSRIEKRLCQSHIFLNNSQILAVLFGFIKYGKGSDIFYELMERRTITLIDTFTLDQLKKLVTLYANLPKQSHSIFKGIEKHVIENFKKIPRSFISILFQTFAEFGYVSENLYKNTETYLLNNVYNMDNEEFSKNLWAFALYGPKSEVYFKKAAECARTKLGEYTAKELATLIWSFSTGHYQDNELYNLMEEQVYCKLQTHSYTIREIAVLLWAYIQKVPLRPPTVDLMKSESLRQKNEAESWDIAIILWGFSKFDNYSVKELFKELEDICIELIPEMTNYELTISLRAYAEANVGNEALYTQFKEKTLEVLNELTYNESVTCAYCFSLKDQALFKDVIEKLTDRAKYLQKQMQLSEQRKIQSPENDLQSLETYMKNEAIEKLTKQ